MSTSVISARDLGDARHVDSIQPEKLSKYIERPEYGFTTSATDVGKEPHLLRITDIQNGGVRWDTLPRCGSEPPPEKLLRSGDIVVARIGGTTGKSFLVESNVHETAFASYLIRVRTNPKKLLPKYLYYFMQTPTYWSYIHGRKGDRLKGGINIPVIESIPITVPALSEQSKVVGLLDQVQAAIRNEVNSERNASRLKVETMRQLFSRGLRGGEQRQTPLGSVPASWGSVRIASLGEVVTGTTPPTKDVANYAGGEIPFVAPGDIEHGFRITKTAKHITSRGLAAARSLPAGSVCFVCIGSTIGKVGLTAFPVCATNQQINAIIPDAAYDATYIFYLMTYWSDYISAQASPGPVPILSKGAFEGLKIYTSADPHEQREISNILETLDRKVEVHRRRTHVLERIFADVLRQLMVPSKDYRSPLLSAMNEGV